MELARDLVDVFRRWWLAPGGGGRPALFAHRYHRLLDYAEEAQCAAGFANANLHRGGHQANDRQHHARGLWKLGTKLETGLSAYSVGRRVRVLRRDLDQLIAEAEGLGHERQSARRRRWPGRRGVARRSGVLGRPVGLRSTTLDKRFYDVLPVNPLFQ